MANVGFKTPAQCDCEFDGGIDTALPTWSMADECICVLFLCYRPNVSRWIGLHRLHPSPPHPSLSGPAKTIRENGSQRDMPPLYPLLKLVLFSPSPPSLLPSLPPSLAPSLPPSLPPSFPPSLPPYLPPSPPPSFPPSRGPAQSLVSLGKMSLRLSMSSCYENYRYWRQTYWLLRRARRRQLWGLVVAHLSLLLWVILISVQVFFKQQMKSLATSLKAQEHQWVNYELLQGIGSCVIMEYKIHMHMCAHTHTRQSRQVEEAATFSPPETALSRSTAKPPTGR